MNCSFIKLFFLFSVIKATQSRSPFTSENPPIWRVVLPGNELTLLLLIIIAIMKPHVGTYF